MKLNPLPRFFPIDRAVAFSDGVFAVVITLLVLGIEVPEGAVLGGPEVAAERDKLLHQTLVYFVAFWLIGMYWSHHSLLFSSLQRIDRRIVVLNLGLLLPVTLLPFVTQLMGARRDEWEVVGVFALTNLLAAVLLWRIWQYVAVLPEVHKGPQTAAVAQRISKGLGLFAGLMGFGVLVALVDVRAGILCFVLVPLVHFYNYVRDPFGAAPKSSPDD
jgi:uncharacterized membrane protein